MALGSGLRYDAPGVGSLDFTYFNKPPVSHPANGRFNDPVEKDKLRKKEKQHTPRPPIIRTDRGRWVGR